MKDRVKSIEKALKKRALKQNKRKVKVREIVAYQRAPGAVPAGEFKFPPSTTVETEAELIDRMAKYIQQLVEYTAQKHVENNFQNPKNYISPLQLNKMAYDQAKAKVKGKPTKEQVRQEKEAIIAKNNLELDPHKTNHITRLSLNEFGLFPAESQGPLSLEGFKKLLKKIERIARQYPANLHLLLSTIPVKLSNNEVENIGIYVECGETPRIHPFAKAVPSRVDPVYPKTEYNPFTHQHIIDNTQAKNVPHVANLSGTDINILYGGTIIAKSVGGQVFRVGVDICLDHAYQLSKSRLKQDIDLASRTGEFTLPVYASHMVTSNIIETYDDALISDKLTRTDPYYSNRESSIVGAKSKIIEMPVSSETLIKPAFGPETVLSTYPEIALERHTSQLDQEIRMHNRFTIRLHALEIYREQHHSELDAVDREINSYVVSFLILEEAKKLNYPQYSIQKLLDLTQNRNKLLDYLNRIVKTPPAYISLSNLEKLHSNIRVAIELLTREEKRSVEIKNELVSPIKTATSNGKFVQTSSAIRSSPLGYNPYKLFGKIIEGSLGWFMRSGTPKLDSISTPPEVPKTTLDRSPAVPTFESPKAVQMNTFLRSEITSPRLSNHTAGNFTEIKDKISEIQVSDTASETQAESKASEFKRESPGFNMFLKPLSWMEKAEVLLFLSKYSPVTLPWNKAKKLSSQDVDVLQKNLTTLSDLENTYQISKSKRAFRYGVNRAIYEDIGLLLKKTKSEIVSMLKTNRKTNARFEEVQSKISRIKEMLSKVTNRNIEKQLKREEIVEARLSRRRIR